MGDEKRQRDSLVSPLNEMSRNQRVMCRGGIDLIS